MSEPVKIASLELENVKRVHHMQRIRTPGRRRRLGVRLITGAPSMFGPRMGIKSSGPA